MTFIAALAAFAAMPQRVAAGGSDAFALSPAADLTLGVAAATAFVTGRLIDPAPSTAFEFGWPDEVLRAPYSAGLDAASAAVAALGLAGLPFLLDRFDASSILTVGLMYAEAALLSFGAKDILKAAVGRPRPYLAGGARAPGLPEPDEDYESFPSGHTTLAFMTAGFCTAVFAAGDASPAAKWAMGLASHGLAAAVAALRVASGAHYPLDALAGAALGSAVGFLVPLAHARGDERGLEASVAAAPLGLSISFSL